MPEPTDVKNGTEEQSITARPTVEEGREPWPEEVEPASRRERMGSYFRRHPQARWILLLVFLVVVAAGAYLWHYYSLREDTDDAEIDGYIVPVSARVSGTVISVNVAENQQVERGAVLVQLDPKDYQLALQRAQAELASAQAAAAAARTNIPITYTTTVSNLSTAQATLNAAQKEVDAAQARVLEAQADYTRVAADLKRAQLLIAKDEISQQQYDAAVATETSARASVDAARAAEAAAQSRVAQATAGVRSAGTAPQQVAVMQSHAAEADATVQRDLAAVQAAELNLEYTMVRAPFAGVVSQRSVEPGQVITAGQPLFALVDLEDVFVTANFKETQLQHMCPGQPVTIHVDAYNRDYRGYVESLSGATGSQFSLLPPENATGNYVKVVQRLPVKIDFEPGQDAQHLLRPGLSVEPTVRVDQPCRKVAQPNNGPAPLPPSTVPPAPATPAAPPATAPANHAPGASPR